MFYKMLFVQNNINKYYEKKFDDIINFIVSNIYIEDFDNYDLIKINITDINNIIYNKLINVLTNLDIRIDKNRSYIIITEIINVIYYPLLNDIANIFNNYYNIIITKIIYIHDKYYNYDKIYDYCNADRTIEKHHVYYFRRDKSIKSITKDFYILLNNSYLSPYIKNIETETIKYSNIIINYLFAYLDNIKLEYYIKYYLPYEGSILEHIYLFIIEHINLFLDNNVCTHIFNNIELDIITKNKNNENITCIKNDTMKRHNEKT